jgi:hypothetical protein
MIRLRDRLRFWFEDQIKKRVKCKSTYERTSGPIHHWFSLSYASYYVMPRLALQEMPVWWQRCFLFLVNMLPETPGYTCQRRDKKGHFIKDDPWANYRRGTVAKVQEFEKEFFINHNKGG